MTVLTSFSSSDLTAAQEIISTRSFILRPRKSMLPLIPENTFAMLRTCNSFVNRSTLSI